LAYRRVQQVLAKTVIPETQSSFRISEGRVDLDNVLYFDRAMSPEPIIKGVSLSVAPGEVLGVMGLTGSGKSTLGRLIAGAIDPTAGAVRIDGVDLRGSDRIMLGRDIGYYGQNLELFAGTVSDNISRFASNSDSDLLKEAVRAANAEGILSALPNGPETVVKSGQRLLSPGQQQSLLLARAFYGSPKLLVLDSPTSDLDPRCEQAVVNAVAAAKQRGATIVIIAPARGFLQLVDRMLVMSAGRVEKIEARAEVVNPTVPPIQMAEHAVRYRAVAR
jgi:ATP-binding cassette subfamily C protein